MVIENTNTTLRKSPLTSKCVCYVLEIDYKIHGPVCNQITSIVGFLFLSMKLGWASLYAVLSIKLPPKAAGQEGQSENSKTITSVSSWIEL